MKENSVKPAGPGWLQRLGRLSLRQAQCLRLLVAVNREMTSREIETALLMNRGVVTQVMKALLRRKFVAIAITLNKSGNCYRAIHPEDVSDGQLSEYLVAVALRDVVLEKPTV